MSSFEFTGGSAVITGAGSGIGAALARKAAAEGMNVLLADINEQAALAEAEKLQADGIDAVGRRVDVSNSDDVEEAAQWAFDRWGSVRLLVNNAGIEVHGRLWEMSVEQWRRVIDINLNGVYYGLHAYIPRMLASGERAHIVNIASVAALSARAYTAPYGVAKHGVLVMTESAALELAAETDKITVSAVMPGAVATAIFDNATSASDDGLGERERAAMADTLRAGGISPDEAAEIIFAGVRANRLRIHTDPEMSLSLIEDRAKSMRESAVALIES